MEEIKLLTNILHQVIKQYILYLVYLTSLKLNIIITWNFTFYI